MLSNQLIQNLKVLKEDPNRILYYSIVRLNKQQDQISGRLFNKMIVISVHLGGSSNFVHRFQNLVYYYQIK